MKRADPFSFARYGDVPPTSYVGNKGKNVKFEIKKVAAEDMPQVRVSAKRRCSAVIVTFRISQVSGGGLKGRYTFAQLHFHWGAVHTLGSEHTISGESYPMEVGMDGRTDGESSITITMHMVMYVLLQPAWQNCPICLHSCLS